MMDIQTATCFRSTSALPRNSSSGALSLSPLLSESITYNFPRSISNTSTMVVESQVLNFCAMTPHPHPESVEKSDSEKRDFNNIEDQNLSMPPEGAVTPTDESLPKKLKLDFLLHSNRELNYDIKIKDIKDMDQNKDIKLENLDNNGVKYTEQFSYESNDSLADGQSNFGRKQLRHSESLALLEAQCKMGFDKSPPTLSPRTMPDTDFDAGSSGSPCISVSGERRRRKPNSVDIIRRTRDIEPEYFGEDSEESDDDLNESLNMQDGADEVDGDLSVCMPVLANQKEVGKMFDSVDNGLEFNPRKTFEMGLNENNNVIEKIRQTDLNNADDLNKENETQVHDEFEANGVPLPASAKVESAVFNGERVIKQSNQMTPPQTPSSWFHGSAGFNGFPMFPFQGTTDLPFSKYMSPFDSKFSSPECEKDYLKCQYCERTFRRQKNLENHIENTHHGKSPVRKKSGETTGDMYFKCTHCPYTTKHQSNLYVHLRIHTGERPYICGACGVQYSQSHSLKSHIINKHDGIMSYYIKEKRTRSPRGLGYLATQPIPGESSVFKMPTSPMISHYPGTPNGLHLPVSHSQNFPLSLKHSPQGHGMMNSRPSSVPSDISPNGLTSQQQQQLSPSSQQQTLMSPLQQFHRSPFPAPFQPGFDIARLGLMGFPFYPKQLHCKPSPSFHLNGHGPISPPYDNIINLHAGRHPADHPISLPVENPPQAFLQKNHHPLREIDENRHQEEQGAIDLRKRSSDEAIDLAVTPKNRKCTDDNIKCPNCLHLLKLKMLRMNVVRMLSILVPNMNFEEKGINAEGDSVDDLLRDVIESNIHDEESND